jgi:hypothetical protein
MKNHHRVLVRRVFVATSDDLKSRHKATFVRKKYAFVMKFFTTKILCRCGAKLKIFHTIDGSG